MVNPDDYSQRKSSRGYVWLKLFTDLLDEPTFMRLADQAKAVYFEVYLLAGKSDAFGLVTVSDNLQRSRTLPGFCTGQSQTWKKHYTN